MVLPVFAARHETSWLCPVVSHPTHLKLGLSRQNANRNSQHLLDANVALSAIIVELVEKGVGCFRIDPPSALRRWAGGFRFIVSATFFKQYGRRTSFWNKTISIAGVQGLCPLHPHQFFVKNWTKNFYVLVFYSPNDCSQQSLYHKAPDGFPLVFAVRRNAAPAFGRQSGNRNDCL